MLVKDVIDFLDSYAPLKYSEDFDNTGLIVGDKNTNVNGIIICLDSTKEVVQEAIDSTETLPYQTYCIQSRLINTHANFLNFIHEQNEKNVVFQIRADVQNDIYNLYCYKNGEFEFYDIAQIQNYKTSVFMNNIFRTIKENKNLDYLEESDDEDEFENTSPDKFVDMDASYTMNCLYSNKFKYWIPLDITKSSITKNSDIRVN